MSNLFDALGTGQIQMIAILVGIDVILGLVGAFMKNDFVLGKVAGFMKRGVLHYMLGFAVLLAVGDAFPSLAMAITVAYWLIILALAGSILDNLGKIGIPVPKALRK